MDAFEQYTDLVNAANAIVNDTDARYEAFAKAEACMLENVLVSPTYYDIAWSLTHANEYSKINAMYGPCNYKAVNWETVRAVRQGFRRCYSGLSRHKSHSISVRA